MRTSGRRVVEVGNRNCTREVVEGERAIGEPPSLEESCRWLGDSACGKSSSHRLNGSPVSVTTLAYVMLVLTKRAEGSWDAHFQ